jgi:hypothetical protein
MNKDNEQEIQMLELRLKAITQEFDMAMSSDMVLGDVKRLFHELRLTSTKLLDLKKPQAVNER